MNIYELDKLIQSLDTKKDLDLIQFYTKKRVELLKQIENKINVLMKQL